jgi:hypothetical protein
VNFVALRLPSVGLCRTRDKSQEVRRKVRGKEHPQTWTRRSYSKEKKRRAGRKFRLSRAIRSFPTSRHNNSRSLLSDTSDRSGFSEHLLGHRMHHQKNFPTKGFFVISWLWREKFSSVVFMCGAGMQDESKQRWQLDPFGSQCTKVGSAPVYTGFWLMAVEQVFLRIMPYCVQVIRGPSSKKPKNSCPCAGRSEQTLVSPNGARALVCSQQESAFVAILFCKTESCNEPVMV